jgi:hypothetical protein
VRNTNRTGTGYGGTPIQHTGCWEMPTQQELGMERYNGTIILESMCLVPMFGHRERSTFYWSIFHVYAYIWGIYRCVYISLSACEVTKLITVYHRLRIGPMLTVKDVIDGSEELRVLEFNCIQSIYDHHDYHKIIIIRINATNNNLFVIPFYSQSVTVYSPNCVKTYIMACSSVQ